ncbi:MAG: peptide ABC transporter substrate-binding protein [Chloroflexi bacterium]|nr:peptide ABC transporter substrate-binding protein [Chloroflexota bacterium]MDA1003524.1 peptide ABC transporter substrate-binding protein [Chloroflexota bacterium]MQC27860.1 peptide ABC transporter substrate-binding protein [Chloroflexota bacterium]
MSGQNRVLAILLGVLAVLVVAVGGLSTVLLLAGGGDDDASTGGSGITTGTSGGASGGGAAASGVLRLPGTDPVTLDPALAGDAGSAQYIVEVFGGLVTITPDLEIVPDIAESFEVSPDGLQYTFHLRGDAFFHSGRPVTADDVRYSIERAASPELASPLALPYLGDIVGTRERFFGLAETISGIEVIDDATIRFTLDAPKPYFLAKLTYPTAFVIDRQQVEANPRNWTRQPNGTGPYRLREWRLGERIVLAANDRYHLGAPKVQEVHYLLSGGSALTRFENGELDVAPISVNDIERARDPSSQLNPLYQTSPEFSIFYIAFNTNVPPFDDVNVRRALALAIDRKKVAEVTFNNMVLTATGIMPPQLPGYTASDKTYNFDPDAARAALAASRYGSAEALPPITMTEVGGGAQAGIDTQAFVEQWKQELGVTVEIQQTDFATFLDEQDAGRLQMFNGGWIMDYPDPEDILDLKFHSESQLNDVAYSNAEVDSLLDEARVVRDPERRIQLYQQAEEKIVSDAVWIPLYFSLNHSVVAKRVQGWIEPPMVLPRLRFVEIVE